MFKAKATPDWSFGVMTGFFAGLGFGISFVDVGWIAPESPALRYVQIGAFAVAIVWMVIRNGYAGLLHKSLSG